MSFGIEIFNFLGFFVFGSLNLRLIFKYREKVVSGYFGGEIMFYFSIYYFFELIYFNSN